MAYKHIGNLDIENTQSNFNIGSLSGVQNPDQTMTDLSVREYRRYIVNYRDFENQLIAARNDQSLVNAARESAPEKVKLAEGIAERNRQRYGVTLTPKQLEESRRASQRGQALMQAGGMNQARLAQRDINQNLIGNLMNIGQQARGTAYTGLATAGENAVQRKNAFENAKAAYKQQTAGFIGQLGSTIASVVL